VQDDSAQSFTVRSVEQKSPAKAGEWINAVSVLIAKSSLFIDSPIDTQVSNITQNTATCATGSFRRKLGR